MNISSIHQETGAFWDEIADTYAERDERKATAFLQSGGNYLLASEREKLGDLKPWCKRAIHLQCSHGNDALSLLRQGAQEVVGVDISERLLAVARRKTQALGASATWHCADILQTPEVLNGAADLVYTGKGALCWMMDLSAWARVVARLLAPGGKLYIYEAHPLNWLWDSKASQYVLDPKHGSYFSNELKEGLFSRKTKFVPRGHQWTLGEIVNTVIESGLRIEQLNEYPEPFWDEFPNMPAETHSSPRRAGDRMALIPELRLEIISGRGDLSRCGQVHSFARHPFASASFCEDRARYCVGISGMLLSIASSKGCGRTEARTMPRSTKTLIVTVDRLLAAAYRKAYDEAFRNRDTKSKSLQKFIAGFVEDRLVEELEFVEDELAQQPK